MEVYSLKKSGGEAGQAGSSIKPVPIKQGSLLGKSQKVDRLTIQQNKPVNASSDSQLYPRMLEIAQQVSEKLRQMKVNIQFEVDRNMGRIIIKILDPVSGEVVREIPPEAFMKSVQVINEMKSSLRLQGIEIDAKY